MPFMKSVITEKKFLVLGGAEAACASELAGFDLSAEMRETKSCKLFGWFVESVIGIAFNGFSSSGAMVTLFGTNFGGV